MRCLIDSPAFNSVEMAWVAGLGCTNVTSKGRARVGKDWDASATPKARVPNPSTRMSAGRAIGWHRRGEDPFLTGRCRPEPGLRLSKKY